MQYALMPSPPLRLPRVLLWPGIRKNSRNLYVEVFAAALAGEGARVEHWKPDVPFQVGDVFHVHWPERIQGFRKRRFGWLVKPAVAANFWHTVARVKKAGGVLTWTAHNLRPHKAELHTDPAWNRFFGRFIQEIDGFFPMSRASLDLLTSAYPALREKPHWIIPHPRYTERMPPPSRRDYRAQLSIPRDGFVVGSIGMMSAGKGTDTLAELFATHSQPGDHLILAGACHEELQHRIAAAVGRAHGTIHTLFGRLSDQEVVDLHAAVDVVAFLSKTHLNSGTVIQALSNLVPVAAYDSAVMRELQTQCGEGSFILGDDGNLLEAARAFVECKKRGAVPPPDISGLDPVRVAQLQIDAYRELLARRTVPTNGESSHPV